MKSGLDGRNNAESGEAAEGATPVSMKSGLDGRNNADSARTAWFLLMTVSMKSGLEGRNNTNEETGFADFETVSQ